MQISPYQFFQCTSHWLFCVFSATLKTHTLFRSQGFQAFECLYKGKAHTSFTYNNHRFITLHIKLMFQFCSDTVLTLCTRTDTFISILPLLQRHHTVNLITVIFTRFMAFHLHLTLLNQVRFSSLWIIISNVKSWKSRLTLVHARYM